MPDVPQSGLPPWPWPMAPRDNYWSNCAPGGDTCVGAAGTPWIFKLSELQNRLLALGAESSLVETALQILGYANQLLARWTTQTCAGELDDPEQPDPRIMWVAPEIGNGVSVDVYRAVIHASLGSYEDLSHVLHLRAKNAITQDTSAAGLTALAARIGAAWSAWWTDTTTVGALSTATSDSFIPYLTYDRIAISALNYPGENVKPTVTTPTVTWAFTSPLSGTRSMTSDHAFPNEVALCLTLLTDQTGRRTRGRIYLGGMAVGAMMNVTNSADQVGMFHTTGVRGLATRFGTKVIDGIHNDSAAQAEFQIVSRAGGTSRGIGGVKVGVVPDSQRRRRFHQPENKYLCWGTNA